MFHYNMIQIFCFLSIMIIQVLCMAVCCFLVLIVFLCKVSIVCIIGCTGDIVHMKHFSGVRGLLVFPFPLLRLIQLSIDRACV